MGIDRRGADTVDLFLKINLNEMNQALNPVSSWIITLFECSTKRGQRVTANATFIQFL